MAMIGDALVSKIIEKVIDVGFNYLADQFAWHTGMKDERQRLVDALPRIQAVVQAADNALTFHQQITANSPLQKWLQQLKDAIYEADDALDELDYLRLQKQAEADDDRDGGHHKAELDGFNDALFSSREEIVQSHHLILFRCVNGTVAHEFIAGHFSLLQNIASIETEYIAKRLMDYGFHGLKMLWPVPGTLMIEPTEKGAPHPPSLLIADTWMNPYTRDNTTFPAPRLMVPISGRGQQQLTLTFSLFSLPLPKLLGSHNGVNMLLGSHNEVSKIFIDLRALARMVKISPLLKSRSRWPTSSSVMKLKTGPKLLDEDVREAVKLLGSMELDSAALSILISAPQIEIEAFQDFECWAET